MKRIIGGALLGFGIFCIVHLIQYRYGVETKGIIALGVIFLSITLGIVLFFEGNHPT